MITRKDKKHVVEVVRDSVQFLETRAAGERAQQGGYQQPKSNNHK